MQASATDLPFRDGQFEAALAILTIHRWPDRPRGLRELGRVARRRVVLLSWVPPREPFWLTDDYFPQIIELDRPIFPSLEDFQRALGHVEMQPLPIPHDCVDGFLGAYWQRPRAYLDSGVRGAISTFTKLPASDVESGVRKLHRDLEDGTWARRHGHLLEREEIDLGYRIVIAAKG